MTRSPLAMHVLAASLIAGCAHGTLSPLDATKAARVTGKVSAVKVVLADAVPTERRHVYQQMSASDVISDAIVEALSERRMFDAAGDTAIEVRVDVFRLRSTSNAFFNGAFAGVDILNGAVSLHRGDTEPVHFAFKVSGEEEWYFKFSASARFRSMARTLAREVAARFETEA